MSLDTKTKAPQIVPTLRIRFLMVIPQKKNLPKAISQTPLGKDIMSIGICLKISNVESKTLRNCELDNIAVY